MFTQARAPFLGGGYRGQYLPERKIKLMMMRMRMMMMVVVAAVVVAVVLVMMMMMMMIMTIITIKTDVFQNIHYVLSGRGLLIRF